VRGFLALIKDGPLFFAKNSHYANFRERLKKVRLQKYLFSNIKREIVDIDYGVIPHKINLLKKNNLK
jgi:hypothetical protein